jgi:hypothetical protein
MSRLLPARGDWRNPHLSTASRGCGVRSSAAPSRLRSPHRDELAGGSEHDLDRPVLLAGTSRSRASVVESRTSCRRDEGNLWRRGAPSFGRFRLLPHSRGDQVRQLPEYACAVSTTGALCASMSTASMTAFAPRPDVHLTILERDRPPSPSRSSLRHSSASSNRSGTRSTHRSRARPRKYLASERSSTDRAEPVDHECVSLGASAYLTPCHAAGRTPDKTSRIDSSTHDERLSLEQGSGVAGSSRSARPDAPAR